MLRKNYATLLMRRIPIDMEHPSKYNIVSINPHILISISLMYNKLQQGVA
jgi:hypothetical protein